MEGLEVIKQLVDSLTVSLTNILLKIESINPILVRLSDEVKDGKDISQDIIDSINKLKHEVTSYHDWVIQLPVAINNISEICKKLDKLQETADEIKEKTDNIPGISQQFETNNEILEPISNVTKFFTTPIGKIAAFGAAILAIAGSVETIQWIIETFFK